MGREECVERLRQLLPPALEVITDLERHDPNPWRNYQRCVAVPPAAATHLLVIQDDALPCAHFEEVVQSVVEAKPNDILSLFVGGVSLRTRKGFHAAIGLGRRWQPVYFRDIHHVVCLIWPVEAAAEFLDWTQHAQLPGHRSHPRSDDAIVSFWARKTKRTVWATVPNLVEHDDLVPSTIHRPGRSKNDKGRRAIQFVTGDPREIVWTP